MAKEVAEDSSCGWAALLARDTTHASNLGTGQKENWDCQSNTRAPGEESCSDKNSQRAPTEARKAEEAGIGHQAPTDWSADAPQRGNGCCREHSFWGSPGKQIHNPSAIATVSPAEEGEGIGRKQQKLL